MEPKKDEYEIYAHICEERKQTLSVHSLHAAELCGTADAAKPFPTLAYLAGLLHDMGKGTKAFQEYLLLASEHPGQIRNHQDHAATGAIYCWERWKNQDLLTAQILALCICSHHTGLPDCIDETGGSEFLGKLSEDKDTLHYDEAVEIC